MLISKFFDVKETKNLTNLDIPKHDKMIENIKANFKVIEEYFSNNPDAKEILEEYFLDHYNYIYLDKPIFRRNK